MRVNFEVGKARDFFGKRRLSGALVDGLEIFLKWTLRLELEELEQLRLFRSTDPETWSCAGKHLGRRLAKRKLLPVAPLHPRIYKKRDRFHLDEDL